MTNKKTQKYYPVGMAPGEFFATVYDQISPRTATLIRDNGKLWEILVDESGYSAGASISIDEKFLIPPEKRQIPYKKSTTTP